MICQESGRINMPEYEFIGRLFYRQLGPVARVEQKGAHLRIILKWLS